MNTPTPRERFRKTLDISTGVSELLADSNASYIHWLEKELITVTKERDRLAEALRKAISWGDSASHHILYRQNINWTYLNEAREALQSLNQPTP